MENQPNGCRILTHIHSDTVHVSGLYILLSLFTVRLGSAWVSYVVIKYS